MDLRVLIVGREYPPFIVGGVATHTYNLVNSLEQLGVDVDVISFGNSGKSNGKVTFIDPKSSMISREGQPISRDLLIPYDIASFTRKIIGIIEGNKYDVVHIQEPYVGGLIKAQNKVTTIHDTSYSEVASILAGSPHFRNIERMVFYTSFGFLMEYASLATSKVVITPALHVRNELARKYRLGVSKLVTIMNGVDPRNMYSPISKGKAKEMLGIKDDRILLFTSCQHIARKKLDILLEALSLLKGEYLEKIEVRIGGDGPLRPNLINLAIRLKIDDKVKFLGWLTRDELELHYRASDIFIMSSDYEAGPISMLEAMVAETSVISSNISGFPSLARNGEDALLVPPRDPKSLSKAIENLISDQDLRTKLSQNGRRFANRFTWDKVAEMTIKIYESVVGN
ncbi:MAG: glycosyltransferase family 4 protein [Nitrososphaeria archaeon]|jgi:glycosyltransferase involved in cell wall biosynthesis